MSTPMLVGFSLPYGLGDSPLGSFYAFVNIFDYYMTIRYI